MKKMMMKTMSLGMKFLKVASIVLMLTFTATHFSLAQENHNDDDILDLLPGVLAASKLSTDYDGDGYTENQGDCNDAVAVIHPNASEICGDGIDQDCSGEDQLCPQDIDNDFDGYTESQGDCNDSVGSIHPNASEICGDGIDQDCSGSDETCSTGEVDNSLINSWAWIEGPVNLISNITFRNDGTYQFNFGGGCLEQGTWTKTSTSITHKSITATSSCDFFEAGEVATSNYSFENEGNLIFNFEKEYGNSVYTPSAPTSYSDNGDGTVTDSSTGLTWQQTNDNVLRTFDRAMSYCSNLTLGGSSYWRMPTADELVTLVDLNQTPAIDNSYFPGVTYFDVPGSNWSWYWTTTPSPYSPSGQLIVIAFGDIADGGTNMTSGDNIFVRCVQ